jgi:hypothetical protein
MKTPVFDPQRDGNPFAWIVKTAQTLRSQAREQHNLDSLLVAPLLSKYEEQLRERIRTFERLDAKVSKRAHPPRGVTRMADWNM